MTTPKVKLKVGVIGLGIIGSRVAAGLRAAGHQVYVWSRTPRSSPNFLGSVVEVADLCDVIQIFVSDDAALLETVRTMAAALNPRHLVAGHATVSPSAARQAAAIIESQGARYLDAPFTGSKVAAQNLQLVYYVGSSAQALAEALPVLETTSRKILHVGEIGQASVLKIATNMVTGVLGETLAEALAVVRGSGLDGQKLVDALEFNASRSATADAKLAAMLTGDYEPNFPLKHAHKDLKLALALAHELKIELPATAAASGAMRAAIDKNHGDQDFAAVSENYEKPPARPGAAKPVHVVPAPPAPILPVPEPVGAAPRRGTLRIIRDLLKREDAPS